MLYKKLKLKKSCPEEIFTSNVVLLGVSSTNSNDLLLVVLDTLSIKKDEIGF